VNTNETVQRCPAGSVPSHVVDAILKLVWLVPVIFRLLRVTIVLPLLVRVTIWGPLGVPTPWVPKARFRGLRVKAEIACVNAGEVLEEKSESPE
jgi:hypothetical protein